MRSVRTIVSTLLACACNDAGFKSHDNAEKPPLVLTTQCSEDGEYGEADLEFVTEPDAERRVVLKGEFCPKAPAQLRLVFVVDFSLSMYNEQYDRGNDKVIDGSCGRLEAARAIVRRHLQQIDPANTEVKGAVISFSDDASTLVPLTDLDALEKKLTVKNLCGGAGGTNYKAAFEETEELLKPEQGTKVVYFISDGLPTVGGGGEKGNAPRHRDAAMEAAEALRKLPKLVFNTVFLGNVHEIQDETLDPEEFLKELTGDAERVKFVDKAENLAKGITELESPVVEIVEKTAQAAVIRGAAGEVKVGLDQFEPSQDREQVWLFTTKPFKPFEGLIDGSGSLAAPAQVVILAKDVEGDDYRVTFTIGTGAEVLEDDTGD